MTITSVCHLWLSQITYHSWWPLSPMTLITQDHHQWPSLPFTTHDYDFLLTTSTHVLSFMSYHSCLIIHVLSLMSYHSCLVSHVYLWPWLMTIMTYDLQLITRDYHIRPSSMTIIHDHQVWSLDFSPMTSHSWLLRSSHQWPWLTIGDFPSYDHHPWAWHPPYDHDFSPMTSHPTAMPTLWPWSVLNDHQDTHPWPSEWSAMSTLGLSCGQLTWTIWWVSMMSTMIDTSTLIDTSIVHEESMSMRVWESMREYERMRVWYPLIKMTEMIEMIEMIETTKEGQKRFWWYFLNIVCFLVFLCIVVWVWVVSGVFVECVLVGVGDWYKRSWVGKWVAPAILGD